MNIGNAIVAAAAIGGAVTLVVTGHGDWVAVPVMLVFFLLMA